MESKNRGKDISFPNNDKTKVKKEKNNIEF